jgi:Ca2+-binding EF-hand superfamily protein
LKSAFEKEDEHFSGKLLKSLFCGIIKKYTKEFTEEDLIKFIRLTKLTGNITHEVEYIKFINMVYYNPNLDAFLLSVNELSEVYTTEANKNLKNLISIINNTKFSDEDNINNNNDYINIDQLYLYINDRIKTKLEKTCNKLEEPITKTIICKFDVDSDGKISLDDLKSILQRYTNTDFFKYENDSQSLNINLFSNQILSDIEYRSIVKKIKEHMDMKKISELGLFKLLDENKDGFINNIEFNKNIKNIIELNPSLSDRFFNYLDGYKNGMVDLNTFLERFKEFKLDNIVENNTKTENYILKRIARYLMENLNKLKEEEIFCLIDKDGDGVVSLEDFKYFVIKELGVFKSEINDFKLERVMQNISLSKNLNITFADISELITKIKLNQKPNSYYIDLKEIFKETNNMNLSISKKNKDWIIQLIEKLGLYISQKFDNVSNFFNLYGNLNENKFRFEDFNKFLEKNSECFDGFNPSKDEIMSVFTALDSQKKNYLTLDDLKKN